MSYLICIHEGNGTELAVYHCDEPPSYEIEQVPLIANVNGIKHHVGNREEPFVKFVPNNGSRPNLVTRVPLGRLVSVVEAK